MSVSRGASVIAPCIFLKNLASSKIEIWSFRAGLFRPVQRGATGFEKKSASRLDLSTSAELISSKPILVLRAAFDALEFEMERTLSIHRED
jgi:hypothetical protein